MAEYREKTLTRKVIISSIFFILIYFHLSLKAIEASTSN